MKLQLVIIAASALCASAAAAQGTFSPGGKPGSTFGSGASPSAPKPGSYLPQAPAPSASRPKVYGAPETPKPGGFEPYKPFSGSSTYSRPNGAPRPDPCRTSVYVNACEK